MKLRVMLLACVIVVAGCGHFDYPRAGAGIMIDVSHVSDETFYQVMELSTAPVIASHSSCRVFTPDWERNMDDDMIPRLAEGGGVIQINFGSAFLLEEARQESSEFWSKYGEYLESNHLEHADESARSRRPVGEVERVARAAQGA